MLLVRSPSSSSVAVTPSKGSNFSPNWTILSWAFITGILLSVVIFGFTTTELSTIVVLFPLSVALYITL